MLSYWLPLTPAAQLDSLGAPTTSVPSGNIKATIWQNVSEKGSFFSTTFSRPFKDQSGAWRNGTSFGLNDLEAIITVAYDAKEWITAHALKR